MNKKALILLPISAMMLLASCGGDKDEKPVDAGTIRDKIVHITLKTSGGNDHIALFNKYVQSFRKVEPNIRVAIEKVGGGYDGIATKTMEELNSGLHGDMVVMYPDAIAMAMTTPFVYDLTKYIDNPTYGLTKIEKADYNSVYLEEGGKYSLPGIYSLPFSKSTEAMFYNAEVLIDRVIPNVNGGKKLSHSYFANMTWEKLFGEFCPGVEAYLKTDEGAALIDTTGEKGYCIVGYDSDANLFITLAEQYGLPYTANNQETGVSSYDWNTPEMRELMKKFHGYKQKHWIETAGSLNERPNNLFTKNQCLLSIGSTGGVKYQISEANPSTVVPVKIPHAENKPYKVISQGPSIGFLRHRLKEGGWDKDRQLASWLFYKHITSTSNNIDWAINARYLPIRNSAARSKQYQDFADPDKFAATPQTLNALFARTNKLTSTEYKPQDFYTSPAFKGSAKCRQEVDKLVTAVLKSDGKDATIKKLFDDTLNEVKK